MNEEGMKRVMGRNYHVCEKCSDSDSVVERMLCQISLPVTRGDIDMLWSEINSLKAELAFIKKHRIQI